MRQTEKALIFLAVLWATACTACNPTATQTPRGLITQTRAPGLTSDRAAAPIEEAASPASKYKSVIGASRPSPSPTVEPEPQLPPGLVRGKALELSMPGDRPLRVAHAEADQPQAIIYLHGMCGNPKGADSWLDLATQRGTFIVLRATIPCPSRPGYKWPQEPHLIQERIDAALDRVKVERGGLLNLDEVLLIGYSQGAHRAEKIAAVHPRRYRQIVLGGSPTSPTPEKLHQGQSIAILAGELEDSSHMEAGYFSLRDAGIRTHFFLLPRAHHGGYGPEGRRVMGEVFAWLLDSPSR